jgi:O-antigen/teichoic acid export membrane protein
MITSHLGLDFTGVFSIAFFMGVVVDIPSRSISAISQPIAAQSMKEGDLQAANQLYKKVSLHQLIAGGLIFLLIWINIDNIFAIIPNGHLYVAGKWVVFFIALSRLIIVTFNFGGVLVAYSKYYYWGLFFAVFITITGIITNNLLIPKLGITGAAIATLITTILLIVVQQWIVFAKIKGNPFSKGTLKILMLILILYGINFLLPHWSSYPLIDGIYRTIAIGIIALISVYKLKISEEINSTAKQFLLKIRP